MEALVCPPKTLPFPAVDWGQCNQGAGKAEVETDMDLKIEKEQPLISG